MFNPPKSARRGRRAARRASRRARRSGRKASASGSAWKILVKKYGVRGAMEHRAGKVSGRSSKMARKARRSHRKARRGHRKARRSRRRARKNPVFVPSFNPSRKRRSHRRRSRKNPFTKRSARRAGRKAWHTKPGRRSMLRKSRRNIRKALNQRFGARRWRKHSRAKWNPALTLSGLTGSVSSVFSMESLYDGLAIGAGVIGALALPGLVQRILPASISEKVNLTSGWTGYLANALSAGLLGFAASKIVNPNVGRKVLLGGLGATVARIALERIPGLAGKTGVGISMAGLGANPELSSLLAREVASEMQSRGAMGAYLTPSQVVSAEQLGDYATPVQVANADSLGLYDATGEF